MTDLMQDGQEPVIAHLMQPRSYPNQPQQIERIDTHGAIIFLAGSYAYKLKRAVKLAYLDFTQLETRRAVCERELELNSRTAPEIYRRILPVTRDAQGAYALAGAGEAVDWVIEMRRFADDQLFDRLAERHELTLALVNKLARIVELFHRQVRPVADANWPDSLAQVLLTVTDALESDRLAGAGGESTAQKLRDQMNCHRDLLALRREAGYVRRCHGDMHLKNIVLFDGEPRLFDALEFDEDLATVDVLYDLGFLLMDLWHRDLFDEANVLANHYFNNMQPTDEWDGLRLLPLFTGLRAGVRAMVGLDGLKLASGEKYDRLLSETRQYALLAGALIDPPKPRCIVIGGLSGTGKTTVSRGIASGLGPMPGAIHLRSDVERKRLFGVEETQKLGAEGYTENVSSQIYKAIIAKASRILRNGHSVILDATFSHQSDRDLLANALGAEAECIWLQAAGHQLVERVSQRQGDASDADADIVREQLKNSSMPPTGWAIIDASAGAPQTILALRKHLDLSV